MQTFKTFQKRSFAFSLSNDSGSSNVMCETKKLKTSTSELRKQAEKVLQNHIDSKIQLNKSQLKAAQHVVYSLKTQNSSLIINALDDILSQLEQRYERVKSAVLQCIQYTNHIEKTRQTMLSVDSILSLKNDKYQEKFNSYRYKVDSIRTALENLKESYLMSNEDMLGKMEVISVYENDSRSYDRIINENKKREEMMGMEIENMNRVISECEYKLKEYQNENNNLKSELDSLSISLLNENKRIMEEENSRQSQLTTTATEYIKNIEIQSNNNMNNIMTLENEINKTKNQLIDDENDNNMLIEKKIQLTNVNGMLKEEMRIYENEVNEMSEKINEKRNEFNRMKEEEMMMNRENELNLEKMNEVMKEIEKQQTESDKIIVMIEEIDKNDKILDNNITEIEKQIETKIIENKKQDELKLTLNNEEQSFSELIDYKNKLTSDINEMKITKEKQEKEKEKNEIKTIEYKKLNDEKEKLENEIVENEEILKAKSNELKQLNEEISNLNIQINEIAKKYNNNNNNNNNEIVIELNEEMKIEIERKVENYMNNIEEEHMRKCEIIIETGNKMKEEIRRGYNERTENRIKLLKQQHEKKMREKEIEKEKENFNNYYNNNNNNNRIGIYNATTRIYKKPVIEPAATKITTKTTTSTASAVGIENSNKTKENKHFKSSIQKTRHKTKKSTVASVKKTEIETRDSDWFNDDIFTFN